MLCSAPMPTKIAGARGRAHKTDWSWQPPEPIAPPLPAEPEDEPIDWFAFHEELKGNTVERVRHEGVKALALASTVDNLVILSKPGVYAVTLPGSERIKVGFTTNLDDRIHTLETGSPFPLKVLLFMPGAFHLETSLHLRLARYRTHREWFQDVPEVRAVLADACLRHGGISLL